MRKFFKLAAIAAILISCISCNETGRKKALLPNVSGKAGEIIVVINKSDWEGTVGNDLRELLASDCPFLPQKEPLYRLVNIVPSTFTNIFQVHRNLFLVNIDSAVTEPGVVFLRDKWAHPQCVIQVNAIDSESAAMLIEENSALILSSFEQAERDRVISNAIKYEERSSRLSLRKWLAAPLISLPDILSRNGHRISSGYHTRPHTPTRAFSYTDIRLQEKMISP